MCRRDVRAPGIRHADVMIGNQRVDAGSRVTRHVPRSCLMPSSHAEVNVPSMTRDWTAPRKVADAWQLRSGSQYDAIVPLTRPSSARTNLIVSTCVKDASIGARRGSPGGYGRYGRRAPSAIMRTSPEACSSPADNVNSMRPRRPGDEVEYEPRQWPANVSQSARLAYTGTKGGFPAQALVTSAIASIALAHARLHIRSGEHVL